MTLSAQSAAKYELKSAIIQKEIAMMGQTLNATWYIDGAGERESVEMAIKNGLAQGVDKHIRTITEGMSVIVIDMDLKVGNRMNLPEKPVNYLQLTPEVREKHKIKDGGEGEIAGKKCRKYSLEITQMGQTALATVWIWKGIPLKTEVGSNGIVITETAIEIQENAPVPEEKFETPEGVVIK
jgi:hypothetical protein